MSRFCSEWIRQFVIAFSLSSKAEIELHEFFYLSREPDRVSRVFLSALKNRIEFLAFFYLPRESDLYTILFRISQ